MFESRGKAGRDRVLHYSLTFTFQHFGLGFRSGSWLCLFNVALHYDWLLLLVTVYLVYWMANKWNGFDQE